LEQEARDLRDKLQVVKQHKLVATVVKQHKLVVS
jgi:hypothetical protein